MRHRFPVIQAALLAGLAMLVGTPAAAQFPVALTLRSDGSLVQSPVTSASTRYRITVEGSYSMWPQFQDCHGVDAAYVYDVPQEEIDAWRWPPETITIGTTTIPFVEIPHWVGDTRTWSFPETGTPLFSLSFRRYKGFRIDGEPLPNTGLSMVTHRYQVEKMGTGAPFAFSILDSNYNIMTQSAVPRYEDNCGSLKITVEAVGTTDLNICDLIPICDATHRYAGANLRVSLFRNPVNGEPIHLLQNANPAHFTITPQGGAPYTIDSIRCGRSDQRAAVGLLIDRSGSMAGAISESDPTIRMTASRSAVHNFIGHLQPGDSAFVASFADMYSVNQDWTDSKPLLAAAVDNMLPEGQTAFFGSVAEALEKVSQSANPRRALIVLSDGANTAPPYYTPAFLTFVQNINIPVYIIALGLSQSMEDIDGRMKMDKIATASRGHVYDVYSASTLDSVFNALGRDLGLEECCSFYFRMPPCLNGTERTFTVTYKPDANPGMSRSITVKCDTCTVLTDVDIPGASLSGPPGIGIAPNPAGWETTVSYIVGQPGPAVITLVDMQGTVMREERILHTSTGVQSFTLSNLRVPAGSYIVVVQTAAGIGARRLLMLGQR